MKHLADAIRIVNRAGRALGRFGVPLGRGLAPDALEAAAARAEGHDDFGDRHYRAGLEALAGSLERDGRLTVVGRFHARNLITQALSTRLRLARARARRPELDTAPFTPPPLVVCGLPRSGTTFLHRLLSELDGAQPLPLWQLMEPLPGRGPDRRIEEAHRRIGRLTALAPDIDAQHYMRPELPDECGHLLKPGFVSSLYWQAPAPGYLEWYLKAPVLPAYRDYRALLQALVLPGRRLTLKDPFHARHLAELFEVVPDAMVVVTHRDPVEVVPSLHKLTRTLQRVMSDDVDVPRMVDLNTRWLASVVERNLAARERVPADRVLDVDYRDLLQDPVACVERIAARFALPWDERVAARLRAFAAENAQRKHGDNPYAAEEFGQTRAAIAERFAPYRERFILR